MCSFCKKILQDPVTLSNGSNYCKKCIKDYFNKSKVMKDPIKNTLVENRTV